MSTFKVSVPPTSDQGSFTCTARGGRNETMRQNALWHYNSARAHDGQLPLLRMPAGTTYTRTRS